MLINPTGEPEAWEPRPQGLNFKFPRLHTHRLMLKQPLDEDRDFLTKLFSDPEVMRYIWHGHLTSDQAARYADTIIGLTQFSINHGWWVVSRHEDRKRLGLACLGKYRNRPSNHPWGDDLQIDYQFARSEWGQGYATEALNRVLVYAFGWLYRKELPLVLAWTRTDNLPSQKLLIRLAFNRFGTCRDEAKIPNPCYLYELTRERWLGLPNSRSPSLP